MSFMFGAFVDETITNPFLEHSCSFTPANPSPRGWDIKPSIQKPDQLTLASYIFSIWASVCPHNIPMPSKNQSNRFRQHQCPPPRRPSQGEVVVNGPDRVVKSKFNASVSLPWLKNIWWDPSNFTGLWPWKLYMGRILRKCWKKMK